MADFVVDSSVWIAGLKQDDPSHFPALPFLGEFEKGNHRVYLPRIVFVEVCARLGLALGPAVAMAIRKRFNHWHDLGWVAFYDLDETRTGQAIDAAFRYRLRGADAVGAALADEVQSPVLAFDRRVLSGYPNARIP